MMMIILVLLAETIAASFASYFLKKSANTGEKSKAYILLSPLFYLGGILYVFSALCGIYLLQKLPYAVVLPIGSLTYVWTLFVSRWLLKEKITRRKVLGMAVLITGVILVGVGSTL
ncbi:MAG: EamA family transporter [Lachnospiraceae bacterium]|jgi:drug/metabolite transporter (DMT)-like permease|nr:EamA family transporter [Lachnospiraceae bacterium]MCR5425537.1 EamA family transporter [Lachnospiraceae bacterium]